ncbi:MAG: hypothetical protein ACYDCK_14180 [Thermoplasmatota archaeon]
MRVTLVILVLAAVAIAPHASAAIPCDAQPSLDVPVSSVDVQAGTSRCHSAWHDGEGGSGTVDDRVHYVHAGESSTGTAVDVTVGRVNMTSSDPDLGSARTEYWGIVADVTLIDQLETGADVGVMQGHSTSNSGGHTCWTNVDLLVTYEALDDTCALPDGWADALP